MLNHQDALDFFYENIHKAEVTLDGNPIIYLRKAGGVHQSIRDARQKIIEENKYHDRFYNGDLDDFVIHIGDGKHLPEHVDLLKNKVPDSYEHARMNWIVSAPESGGLIVSDGKEYAPKLNDIHYIDGKKLHGVTMVHGNTPLVLYSFGFIKRHIGYV
jgi:hypothetical protein